MENLKNYLFELCSDNAPSGREDLLTSLDKLVRPYCDKCYRDNFGNLIAFKKSNSPDAKKIMLDAHVDEVGLVVTGIDDLGFIHFANHTGIDSRILPASTVTIIAKNLNLTGIVATLPPHLLKDADTTKAIKTSEMVIDIGYSAEKAKELVRVGDYITLRSGCADLRNNLVMGKSFDNRASAAVVVELIHTLSRVGSCYDVYAVFSAGEEFGGYGAKRAATFIAPDRAIVLDTTFAVSPYTNKAKGKELGCGPAIAKGPILDNNMSETLVGVARSRAIDYQIEVLSRATGTNADGIISSGCGVPTAVVSIPLRYMHSAGEIVSLEDMHNTVRLLLGYITQRGGVF